MKILHFLIGDSFAVRFLSIFTNSTINEHHAIEFDWSNGEENIMDISKLGSQTTFFETAGERFRRVLPPSQAFFLRKRRTPVKLPRYNFESSKEFQVWRFYRVAYFVFFYTRGQTIYCWWSL